MASGRFMKADGVELWYRQFNRSRTDLPWLVCFHGFPTSSWDWHRLLPLLENRFRILVFDFPGYGLSGKPTDRDYSLLRQCDAAEALLAALDIRRFHLLAHDMGVTVACEWMYRQQDGTSSFEALGYSVLNAGLYMTLHRPLPTQRLLRIPVLGTLTGRLASWRLFRNQYPLVYADPESFSSEHYREQWSLILHNHGRRTMAKVAGYMRERERRGQRWTRPIEQSRLPMQVIWGLSDPIAVPEIADRLEERNPSAAFHRLQGVGHYPQLEAPEVVAGHILAFVHD